jgi:tripartite-type tricarboxylate transporter receptor subunit TctC
LVGKLCAAAAQATIAPAAAAAQRLNQNIHFLLRRGRQFRLRTMRTLFLVLACAAFAAAHAQSYPSKPIRIVVPYAAGGTSDILARQIGPKLSDTWGQPVVVENKPGANGNVGADFVAKSAPDGYTLLLTDLGGLLISASVYPQLPFNPAKDFTPVIMVSYSPHVLAVHPSVPVKDVRELIALAKAQPGKLNFAISGIGGAPHLAGIEFAQRTGVQWTYIPYKGGSDAVAAVAAGQADVLFNGMLATWPTVQGGRMRALAISSAQRVPSAPDTPTVAEQGLPGFETGSFQGVVGPSGISRETVARLNAELIKVLASAEMKERFAKQGTEVRTGTPESLGEWLRTEQARFARVVKESGAKFD